MKFRRERKLKARALLDMTPLVDVVLLLVLFFMLTSTFVAHSSIPIEMPQAAGAEPKPALEDKDISITLATGAGGPGGKGPIYVNQSPVKSFDQLSQLLERRRTENPDATALILVDQNTSSGRLVEVLGIASSAGIRHYSIAAQTPGAEK